jgi:hemoglobin
MDGPEIFAALGGAEGCLAFTESFYRKVAKDPLLKPLFPAHLRCAIEAFSAFLVQFLGGPPEHSQQRWWLSLLESHRRFQIGPKEREAWLRLMNATLDELRPEPARIALKSFFDHASAYLIHQESSADSALSSEWDAQLALDQAVAAIAAGDSGLAMELAGRCKRHVLSGLFARMIAAGNPALREYVQGRLGDDPSLAQDRYAGRTLLHNAAAAGDLQTVRLLLEIGLDPNVPDGGRHTPLYSVANECGASRGAEIVHALVEAGANVNAADGVQRCTPLHMAARRGFTGIAEALIQCGADINATDRRGDTPLRRALNCRKASVAEMLAARGAHS